MKLLRSLLSSRHATPLLLLICLPLLANFFVITGIFRCDPELHYSGLGMDMARGLLPGATCFVDPTVAYITQPLGYLSAQDWLHGIIPWWNPFSGVGMPLAAEMQTESFFFPFVLLLHFHSGWLIQKILFQILSCCFCYAFLIELRLTRLAAFFGAALYGLNGSFILTAHANIGPIMCLPMLLWGIEKTFQSAGYRWDAGCSIIVSAVAVSIYAGFPELAYFNGLLAMLWTSFRFLCCVERQKLWFALKIGASVVLGVALTAPLLIPFLGYLVNADIGAHAGVFIRDTLSPAAAPVQLMPLFYGALAKPAPPELSNYFHDVWVRIGGWFGCSPVLLAIYALVPKGRATPGRYILAFWIALWEARYFGLPAAITLVNIIPGVATADAIRFSTASVELSMFVLAAYGINDLQQGVPARRWQIGTAFSAFAVCLILSVAPVIHVLPGWFSAYPKLIITSAIYLSALIAADLMIIFLLFRRHQLVFPIGMIIGGAVLLSVVTELAGAPAGHQDTSAIARLQSLLGMQRFYTLGPFQPNYSAEYGLSSINYAQLPVPKDWSDYVTSRLFPFADIITFGGGEQGQAAALLDNLSAYKDIGVRYVLAPTHTDPFDPSLRSPVSTVWSKGAILGSGGFIAGTIPQGLGARSNIDRVSVEIATYHGAANGPLVIQLCTRDACTSGQTFLDHAADDAPLMIKLTSPILVGAKDPLTYTITHISGTQAVIWMASERGGVQEVHGNVAIPKYVAPMLTFYQYQKIPIAKVAFDDNQVTIFDLGNVTPYMSAPQSNCRIVVLSRQAARADCSGPATLVRQELYFPGWRASIDGRQVPLRRAGQLFQQISLPEGVSEIRFSYSPPDIQLACAIGMLALLTWMICMFLGYRQPK